MATIEQIRETLYFRLADAATNLQMSNRLDFLSFNSRPASLVQKEFIQFFGPTSDAHWFSFVVRLASVFDTDSKAIRLVDFCAKVRDSKSDPDEKDDCNKIFQEASALQNEAKNGIYKLRNQFYAHQSKAFFERKLSVPGITVDDCQSLLDRAKAVFSRASENYDGKKYPFPLPRETFVDSVVFGLVHLIENSI